MPQQYTMQEVSAMSAEEFARAREEGFIKPFEQTSPSPTPPQSYADTGRAWQQAQDGFDFRTPAPYNHLCRLRDLPIDKLAAEGLLDKLTRLPGLAEEQVRKAEGQPPSPAVDPETVDMSELLRLVNHIVPLVVVEPSIAPLPAEGEARVSGVIYVDSIPWQERIAIMNRVVAPAADFDNFRQ